MYAHDPVTRLSMVAMLKVPDGDPLTLIVAILAMRESHLPHDRLVIVARDLKQNVSDGIRERDSGRDVRLDSKAPPLSLELCDLTNEW